ncbi:unnamed protein product [Rhizopus microsporus]
MQYRRLKKEILLLDTRMHHSSKMMISGKKGCVLFFFSFSFFKHTPMAVTGRLADIAQKSAVLLLAGTTVYYMVNVGMLVNCRMELKKQGKLQEELVSTWTL